MQYAPHCLCHLGLVSLLLNLVALGATDAGDTVPAIFRQSLCGPSTTVSARVATNSGAAVVK
jgi:hypothetical protein